MNILFLLFYSAKPQWQEYFIIWLKWSMVKRSILIGSLSGPYFPLWIAKMDCSQTDFTDLCF